MRRFLVYAGSVPVICAFAVLAFAANRTMAADNEEQVIAESLAAMLRAGRTVISANQDKINNPDIENKGLDGKTVLAEAIKVYRETTSVDPLTVDPATRHGRLLRVQMESIAEVVDANQKTINQKGVAFKGFIPATFARLVNESFGKGAANDAEMKATAPPQLVRNRKARADEWEAGVIRDKLLSADWPKGQMFSTAAASKGRSAFRFAVPEYYAPSCLSCHGVPKGQIDITGYPKEGAKEGDLGGVVSITLFRQ